MKYLLLLSTLCACNAYPDDCYVHVYVPCDAGVLGADEDAGQPLFEPTHRRVIDVGKGEYIGLDN